MATKKPVAPRPLTRRQNEVVRFVRRFVATNGFPPTLREIGSELGMNHNAVAGHLSAVERKGVLRRAGRTARGLTLTPAGDKHGRPR